MNNAVTNLDHLNHGCSFVHQQRLNHGRLAGNPFVLTGANQMNTWLHPQYAQFLNALRFPMLFSPQSSCENEYAKNPLVSLPSNVSAEIIHQTNSSELSSKNENSFNLMSSFINSSLSEKSPLINLSNSPYTISTSHLLPNPSEKLSKTGNGSVFTSEPQQNAPADESGSSEDTDEDGKVTQRPYLKFGVQAILSQASSSVTGKNFTY